ncbi:MAG TPA: glycosyltransferase family A protein [Acidithiobacillus sp.]|nr:glycosyltransferase family A protein [Acidithiobacillus sp.]
MTYVQSEGSEKSPLVSIALTTYKRPEYLKITMASILEQTLGDFELIVSDNANSPEVARICKEFDDARIRYIGREPSLSMVSNAKSSMKLATGKYIANIHDDDVLDARFLETLIHPMEQDDKIGLVFCDFKIIDENGVEDVAVSDQNSKFSGRADLAEGVLPHRADAFVTSVIPQPSGRLFRAGSIDLDEICEEAGGHLDLWMSFLHCKSAFECYYVPERLASYRVHAGSATSLGALKDGESAAFVFSYVLTHQSFPEKNQIIGKKLLRSSFRGAIFHLLLGENAEARAGLIKAFRLTGSVRCIMAYLFAFLPSGLTRPTLKAILHFRK